MYDVSGFYLLIHFQITEQTSNHAGQKGESVSLAEALEIRKNLKSELDMFSERVSDSAYDKLIHKEDRDIVNKSRFFIGTTGPHS